MRISDWSSDVCSSDLAGLRTQAVRGTMTAEQALEKLLEGSGFAVKRDPSGALMIIKSGTAVPEAEPQAATSSTSRATPSAEPEPEDMWKIKVTGTRSEESHVGKECVRPC